MKPRWQLEHEALGRLGFAGVDGSPDRRRAVDTVIELMAEIDRLRKMASAKPAGGSDDAR